jgi:hypothetical protein
VNEVPSQSAPANRPPVTLFDVIALVESRNNPRALRFESAMFSRMINGTINEAQDAILDEIIKRHICSRATALMIFTTSWGKVQIMGFNLYGPVCKYKATVFDYCASDSEQRFAFALLTASMKVPFDLQSLAQSYDLRLQFARKYNGADSYALLVADALKELGFVVSVSSV